MRRRLPAFERAALIGIDARRLDPHQELPAVPPRARDRPCRFEASCRAPAVRRADHPESPARRAHRPHGAPPSRGPVRTKAQGLASAGSDHPPGAVLGDLAGVDRVCRSGDEAELLQQARGDDQADRLNMVQPFEVGVAIDFRPWCSPRRRPKVDEPDRFQPMRADLVGIAHPLRFVANLALEARQPAFANAAGRPRVRAAPRIPDEGELVRIEFLCALAIRVRCCSSSSDSDRASSSPRVLNCAATSCVSRSAAIFSKARDRRSAIPLRQEPYAGDRRRRRFAARRATLPRADRASSPRRARRAAASVLRSRSASVQIAGDRDDLFVQPRGAGAIEGEAAHQHDARLRARPMMTRDASTASTETLADRKRDSNRRTSRCSRCTCTTSGASRRRPGSAARTRPPGSAPCAATRSSRSPRLRGRIAQVVECIGPARDPGECRIRRDRAGRSRPCRPARPARVVEARSRRAINAAAATTLQFLRVDADALARSFEDVAQIVLLLRATAHAARVRRRPFRRGRGEPLRVAFLGDRTASAAA